MRMLKSALATALLVAAAAPLSAQSGDGFLFNSPKLSVTAFGGVTNPRTDSDLFGYVTDLLTLDDSDFTGFAAGGTVGVPLSNRLELTVSSAYLGRVSRSEFRDWVDMDDLPIEQRTEFSRVPILAGVRFYPSGMGESVGSFAWIPNRIAPHVGASAGAVWYRFRQTGDFVDFNDLGIFYDELKSEGVGFAAQASAGVDFALTSRFYLTANGSYLWSQSDLDSDFQDFEPIDLQGYDLTLGLLLRL